MDLGARQDGPFRKQGAFKSFSAHPPSHGTLRAAVIAFGIYAIAGGLLTLLGWATGWGRFTDWGGSGISMKANAAVTSVLAGACLIQIGRNPASSFVRGLTSVVILLGGMTLWEHITLWDLGIDTLLFDEAPGARATSAPGRMGIPASASFLMLGCAILFLTGGPAERKWSVRLGIIAATIAALSLTGHLYGADAMFSIPKFTGIAWQTASIILALALGVILCVPEQDPLRMALEPGAAGVLVRYAIPVLVVVPYGLGWLRLWIQDQGWVDTAFGTALRTVTEVGLLIALLWWAAEVVRRHERALFESREVLRTTLQSIGDGVITTDTLGKVTYLNPVAETFTGWRKQDAIGEPLQEVFNLVDETTGTPVPSSAQQAVDLGTTVTVQDHRLLISRDGVTRPVDDTAAPIRNEEAKVIGCVLVLRDATRRRTSERDLKARADELEKRVQARTTELRSSNEQLEAFIYSIAHDLRAPLRTMASFSQLLTEDHSRQLDDTGKDFLRRIREGAEFMDRLLLDLLAYGRTSQAEMELENVEVQKVLGIATTQLCSQIRETRAAIELQGPLPTVRAHEATLLQCVLNLLTNSMKFVTPGVAPRIIISAETNSKEALEGLPAAKSAAVRVIFCDNGIGIAPEHQERAFRVFERLQGNRYPGTGIGLSIVRKGVERMGGKVGMVSARGEGCRFWIELPPSE